MTRPPATTVALEGVLATARSAGGPNVWRTAVGSRSLSTERVSGVVLVTATLLMRIVPLTTVAATRTDTRKRVTLPAASVPSWQFSAPGVASTQPTELPWNTTSAGS